MLKWNRRDATWPPRRKTEIRKQEVPETKVEPPSGEKKRETGTVPVTPRSVDYKNAYPIFRVIKKSHRQAGGRKVDRGGLARKGAKEIEYDRGTVNLKKTSRVENKERQSAER